MQATPRLFFLFCLFPIMDSAQIDLSPDQWYANLRFLQKTVRR